MSVTTEWMTVWRKGARVLSEDSLDKLMEHCKNEDYPQPDKTLTIYAFPGIAYGGLRQNGDGTFQGTGILQPCAHPIRLKSKNYEALAKALATGFPVRCAYCLKEQEM